MAVRINATTLAGLTAVFLCAVLLLAQTTEAKLKEGDCEVCQNVLSNIDKTITKKQRKEGRDAIEGVIRKFCQAAKNKENSFCYYIGGTQDAATGTLGEVSKRMVNFVPPDKICERLKKLDSQICELKYEKQIDLDTVDLKKLRVKELKNILSVWGEDCKACTEKTDFIKRIESLKSKHQRKKEL